MIFIFYFKEKIELNRSEDGSILLESIPHIKLEEKWPGYFEWYGIKDGKDIRVFRCTSELELKVKQGKGFTDKQYYTHIGSLISNYRDKLVRREVVYKIVSKYFNIDKYRTCNYWDYTMIISARELRRGGIEI